MSSIRLKKQSTRSRVPSEANANEQANSNSKQAPLPQTSKSINIQINHQLILSLTLKLQSKISPFNFQMNDLQLEIIQSPQECNSGMKNSLSLSQQLSPFYFKLDCYYQQLKNNRMSKKNLQFVLIFLIVLAGVYAQRGGGGRGGGGGSSGGGSRGSYYGSRSYSNCVTNCYGEPMCIQRCRSRSTVGTIIGSVIGGLCVTAIGISTCVTCGGCQSCRSKYRYWQLKREYNKIEDNKMSIEQYKMKRDRIIDLINHSESVDNFALKQKEEKVRITAMCHIVKQDGFVTEIGVNGSDKFGAWTAKGFILPRDGEVFFWMYKEYDDKAEAGQTDQWLHLLYTSYKFSNIGLEGKWFYLGFESSDEYSGEWKLLEPNQIAVPLHHT